MQTLPHTVADTMTEPAPQTIVGVASTFSPRFVQVLAEAKRMRDRLGAKLELIYVGEKCDNTVTRFGDVLRQLELPADTKVHYQGGDDPAVAILAAAAAQKIDVIAAGALEKQVVLQPFLGHVARHLVRGWNGSLILFTKPARKPKPVRRMVFMAEYGEHGRAAFKQAVRLATHEECERLYVVRVYTSFDEARAANREQPSPDTRTLDEEECALEKFIDSAGATDVPIEARCIRGNTGYAALDFVQTVKANLLIVPVDNSEDTGKLPPHVAWITETIPCNLWMIR